MPNANDITASSVVWVDQQSSLNRATEQLQQASLLAMDTEFVRRNTYYAVLGLLQIATPDQVFLIDPLAKLDLRGLAQTLAKPGVTKIFHSVGEDLEVLRESLMRPHQLELAGPIFDTQLAATIASLGSMQSLAKLTQKLLAIELDKGETTSNWLARPLSAGQIRYAAADVQVLLPMYELLVKQLTEMERLTWVLEDGAQLLARSCESLTDLQPHHKHKTASRFSLPAQQRLRALLLWREQKARERDLPKNWILPIEATLELAEPLFADLAQLQRVLDLHAPKSSKRGPEIWQVLKQPQAVALEPEPQQVNNQTDFVAIPAPLKGAAAERYKKLRAHADQVAAELGIPAELLANRKMLEGLLNTEPGTALPGWRGQFVRN